MVCDRHPVAFSRFSGRLAGRHSPAPHRAQPRRECARTSPCHAATVPPDSWQQEGHRLSGIGPATPAGPNGLGSTRTAFHTWFVVFLDTLQKCGVAPELRAGSSQRIVDQLVAWLNSLPLDHTSPSLPDGFPLGLRRADQLLQQQVGIGLRAFIERRRLNAARTRLLGETIPIKELAFALGFRHASHFTAWFRRHAGLPPSAYRSSGAPDAA
ncbi:MAG: AraC family transcriptional regulator [Proteobacteria bacterium]|nr:AraC family transcriptional regulator [Pseudomonadota bacterium]